MRKRLGTLGLQPRSASPSLMGTGAPRFARGAGTRPADAGLVGWLRPALLTQGWTVRQPPTVADGGNQTFGLARILGLPGSLAFGSLAGLGWGPRTSSSVRVLACFACSQV